MKIQYKFVDYMPEQINEGVIYISPEYRSVLHLCACGCGEEINTPLSPTDWKLIYNGRDISIEPSIGNWSYECRSHYWIKESKIVWADSWSDSQIEYKRKYDRKQTENYFENKEILKESFNYNNNDSKKELITKTIFSKFLGWFDL